MSCLSCLGQLQRHRRQDSGYAGSVSGSVCCSTSASAVPACSALRREAWRTQRRTVPGCPPTSLATSPTGRPTPTSPTARARTSSPYGHPTPAGPGTTSAGAGLTGPPPTCRTTRAPAELTEPGFGGNPAEHLGDRLSLLAFKPPTSLTANHPDLVAEPRPLGSPGLLAAGVLLVSPHLPTPIAQPIGVPAVSHQPRDPVAITPIGMFP